MGRRIKSNFDRRFSNRINVLYEEKPRGGTERCIQNEKIYRAFNEVVAGIIGREPTEAEIFGLQDVSIKKIMRKRDRVRVI